ncbi:MAG: deoxyribonuclease IV [Thermoleophilia bacterium]
MHMLGVHIRTGGGLSAAARHADAIGSTSFQIMSGNPSAWNPGALDAAQAEKYRGLVAEKKLGPVFLHAGYLINLSCRTGRNAPIYAKSIKLLQENIERAAVLGCEYVVVHMGSRRGTAPGKALKALVDGISRLHPTVAKRLHESIGPSGPPMLLLENSAGSGDTVGASFEELGEVLGAVEERGVEMPLGICLDTAHMWGAGYDLSTKKRVDTIVEDFDRIVGIDRLWLVHFNDSPVERGSRRDKHEHIGCGLIPMAGLRAFARHRKLCRVPLIMETAGNTSPTDEKRMADLRALAGD